MIVLNLRKGELPERIVLNRGGWVYLKPYSNRGHRFSRLLREGADVYIETDNDGNRVRVFRIEGDYREGGEDIRLSWSLERAGEGVSAVYTNGVQNPMESQQLEDFYRCLRKEIASLRNAEIPENPLDAIVHRKDFISRRKEHKEMVRGLAGTVERDLEEYYKQAREASGFLEQSRVPQSL